MRKKRGSMEGHGGAVRECGDSSNDSVLSGKARHTSVGSY